MKFWKKLSIGFLLLLLLSQIPFAYRRYELGSLSATIQKLNSQRVPPSSKGAYNEYLGVLHVHSFLGGHSPGGFEDIIEAAKANKLQFVIMTEHPAREFNTAEMTLKGTHAGVLFINGNEVSTNEGDRLLVIPGDELTGHSSETSTRTLLEQARSRGKLTVVAYPQDFKSWEIEGYDGVEVYNVYTNARQVNPVVGLLDSLWSYRSSHELLFATFFARPSLALSKWDEVIRNKRVVGLAGNDSHANIGISLNDSSGNSLLEVKLDPYETSFRLVRVHLLIPKDLPLDTTTAGKALAAGHCFIGFDLFGDTSGFTFTATNFAENRIQGDEIPLLKEVRLSVSSPIPARIVLFKDGKTLGEETSVSEKEFVINEAGTYRVEAYLPQLGHRVGDQPWIISNPIYVK